MKNVFIFEALFLPPEDFFGDFLARFVNAGTAGLAHRLGPYMSRILDLGIGVSLGGSLGGLSDCLGTGFDETLPPPFPEDPPEDPLPATLYGSSSLEPDPKGRMIGWLLLFMDTGPDCVLYRGVAENLNDAFVISYVDILISFYRIRIHIGKTRCILKKLTRKGWKFRSQHFHCHNVDCHYPYR